MMKKQLLTAAVSALFVCTVGTSVAGKPSGADVDTARIANANAEPGNWMTTGHSYDEQRYSALDKINTGNVSKLGLAWSYKLDVDRGTEATPLVIDGVMYTTGAFSIVYALDAGSGKLLWKFDPKVPKAKAANGCCDVGNRGVAVRKGKVYVGAFDGRLIALNAKTGKKIWETDTTLKQFHTYTITGAPIVVKDKILIGNGGAEFGVRGYVSAYDAETGKLDWRFFTVPGDPGKPQENKALEMAAKTWQGDKWVQTGGGGTVWNTIAYDPDLNLVYFGTGNGIEWNRQLRGQDQKQSNLFLSSIVAVKADTGEYAWHYQEVPGDMWDYDADANVVMADLTIGGKPRKVLLHAPKDGFFYVLDRATGELLSADAFAPMNWAKGIDMATGIPQIDYNAVDWTTGPKIVSPSAFGAHNWQPMSFNPKTGLVYIPEQESAGLLAPDNDAKFDGREGAWNLGNQPFALPEDVKQLEPIAKSFKGKLMAWDPVARKATWTQDYVSLWNGGTMTTAGDLVFQGTADGRVVAYAADSGNKLWESPADTGVVAGPVTYTVKGEQYVTFMAGWGGVYPLLMGGLSQYLKVKPEARILTYKIGGTATLPPPKNEPAPLPTPPALTADDKTVEVGRNTFNANCAVCHGANAMSGGVIPDLRYLTPEKHAIFPGIVYGARAEHGMPSFANRLKPEQVDAIHQYLIKRAHDLQDQLKGAGATPVAQK